jgi:hypothetical protein
MAQGLAKMNNKTINYDGIKPLGHAITELFGFKLSNDQLSNVCKWAREQGDIETRYDVQNRPIK